MCRPVSVGRFRFILSKVVKKKKKVSFVTQSLVVIGGVVRVITNWSNYFVTKQYEVENVSVEQGKPYFHLDKGSFLLGLM